MDESTDGPKTTFFNGFVAHVNRALVFLGDVCYDLIVGVYGVLLATGILVTTWSLAFLAFVASLWLMDDMSSKPSMWDYVPRPIADAIRPVVEVLRIHLSYPQLR